MSNAIDSPKAASCRPFAALPWQQTDGSLAAVASTAKKADVNLNCGPPRGRSISLPQPRRIIDRRELLKAGEEFRFIDRVGDRDLHGSFRVLSNDVHVDELRGRKGTRNRPAG